MSSDTHFSQTMKTQRFVRFSFRDSDFAALVVVVVVCLFVCFVVALACVAGAG